MPTKPIARIIQIIRALSWISFLAPPNPGVWKSETKKSPLHFSKNNTESTVAFKQLTNSRRWEPQASLTSPWYSLLRILPQRAFNPAGSWQTPFGWLARFCNAENHTTCGFPFLRNKLQILKWLGEEVSRFFPYQRSTIDIRKSMHDCNLGKFVISLSFGSSQTLFISLFSQHILRFKAILPSRNSQE